jgi:hypothetical protein
MKHLKNLLLTIFVVTSFLGASVFAAEGPESSATSEERIVSELRSGVIAGVGSYKIRIDNYGEPVTSPLRISVELRCGLQSESKLIFEDVEACAYEGFSREGNSLNLRLSKADGKSEKCTKSETLSLSLKQLKCAR